MLKIIQIMWCFAFGLLTFEASARFVSVDPVHVNPQSAANFNRYHYGNNNPYRFTDPDGRQSRDLELIHKEAAKYGPPHLCCTSLTREQAGAIVDFIPGFGDAKGFAEAYNDPSIGNVLGAAVGMVPIVGDLGKQLIRRADDLIQGAGKLERLKGGVRQGRVEGDAQSIFNTITEGGETLSNGRVKMEDGTIIGAHTSKSTGQTTIDINKGDQIYKIRVEEPKK
jgi:hypothetical protein